MKYPKQVRNPRILPRAFLLPLALAIPLIAQKPFQAQSTSSIALAAKGDESTVDIVNVAYEVAGPGIPGRSPNQRLVLRTTTRTKQVLGDIGVEGKITIEAWPLGVDLKDKPNYTVSVFGTACQTVENELLVVSRGLEETDWWSAYRLGSGAHLFDTYVPLVKFSTTRDVVTQRYAGLEVPPDDTKDPRLRDPKVVAVLTYASGERVIREVLITADDTKQAAQMRAFGDETRELVAGGRDAASSLKVSFSQSYPSAPATKTVMIPIARDDLDVSHAEVSPGVHVAIWKR